jgi:hypothetical protein
MRNKEFASGRPVRIDIGRERPAIVDLQDAQKLATLKWHQDGDGYAVCGSGGGFAMHRVIMRPAKGMVVHHKNEDRMDNQRSNLEVVSGSIHTQRHKIRNDRFGMYKKKCKYESRCGDEGMKMYIGTFDTEIGAAMAYDWAARILHGPDTQMNFPDRIVPALAAYLIRESKGRYFDVGFRKRTTGEFRFFTCRLARHHNPYEKGEYEYILVEVKNLIGYRAVPIEGIETLYIDGKKYKVV